MPTVPQIHQRDTRAAQTAIPVGTLTVGTLFYVTDESLVERWNGTTWESYSAPASGGAPGAHAPTHEDGGTDPLVLDTLAPPTDILTLNATATEHGLLPKLSGAATDYLDGTGAWTVPPVPLHAADHEAVGPDPLDVTQLDGYPGGGTTFLRDDGTFATPAAGVPAAHAASHASAGGDPVTVTGLAGFPGGTTNFLRADGTFASPPGGAPTTAQLTRTLTFLFDNGASDLAAATQTLPVSCPYAGTITAARLLSPQTGAIVLDVWKAAYASYPPTVANTITASAKPTLSAANKSEDTTLTGWTTAVAVGDVFIAKVDSCTGIHACALQLTLVVT